MVEQDESIARVDFFEVIDKIFLRELSEQARHAETSLADLRFRTERRYRVRMHHLERFFQLDLEV